MTPMADQIYAKAVPVPDLVQQGVLQVPEAYLQINPVEYNLTEKNSAEIPVIDLSAEPESIVRELEKACQEWGFFQVINHGIPEQVVEKMLQVSAEFFNLPMSEKMEFSSETPVTKTTRYAFRFDDSSVADWRDFLFMGSCLPVDEETISRWPYKPPSYRESTAEFCKHMNELACQLMEFISASLGLKPDRLKQALGGKSFDYSLLTNRYLPCPQPELVLALRGHSDPNVITLLVQNQVPGLQVLKDGKWITVEGLPNSIIVNLGDQLEITSNGKYISVEHRALANSTSTRYSVASFFEPPRIEPSVGPLPELLIGGDAPRFKSVNYKEYAEVFMAKHALSKTTLSAMEKH